MLSTEDLSGTSDNTLDLMPYFIDNKNKKIRTLQLQEFRNVEPSN